MNEVNGNIDRNELILISRQFGGMLDAGIDILRILDVLREQFANPKAKEVFTSIERDLRLGRRLSTALGRYPEVFSPFYVSMIRQGELDEALAQAFNRVAEHLTRPMGTEDLNAGGSATYPGLHGLVDRITPIAFWLALSSAVTVIAIALLWYATNSGLFDREALGPNVCLLVGVFILVSSLVFARLRPRQWVACSFCGRSQQVSAFMRRSPNGAICDACIESSYLLWQSQRAKPEGAPAASPASSAAVAATVPSAAATPASPEEEEEGEGEPTFYHQEAYVIEEEEEEIIGDEYKVVKETEEYY